MVNVKAEGTDTVVGAELCLLPLTEINPDTAVGTALENVQLENVITAAKLDVKS